MLRECPYSVLVFLGSGGEFIASCTRWNPNPAEESKAKAHLSTSSSLHPFDPVLCSGLLRQAKPFADWTSAGDEESFSNRVNFTAGAANDQSEQSTSAEQTPPRRLLDALWLEEKAKEDEWQVSILAFLSPRPPTRCSFTTPTGTPLISRLVISRYRMR